MGFLRVSTLIVFQLLLSSEGVCLQDTSMYAKDATKASIPVVVTNIAFAKGYSHDEAVLASALASSMHFLHGAIRCVVKSSELGSVTGQSSSR